MFFDSSAETSAPWTIKQPGGFSGAVSRRPGLSRCLRKLEHGDSLVVWKLDRLGRSWRDLIIMLDDLKRRGVKFRSLTEAIDTEAPIGRAMWQLIGVLADYAEWAIMQSHNLEIALWPTVQG